MDESQKHHAECDMLIPFPTTGKTNLVIEVKMSQKLEKAVETFGHRHKVPFCGDNIVISYREHM